MTTKIDSTITVLKGHLTGAAAKKGAEMIGQWEADLEKADWRGAKTIHADLVKLRHHLEGDDLDKGSIAELMVKLGEATGRAAEHAEENNRGKLESLGQTLVKVGESLRGQAHNTHETKE